MNSLAEIIAQQIAHHGPMDVGQFMMLALSHPEHGYYMKQDPLGGAGDFVTAPEVSQMFGEILGAWAAHSWMQMGGPEDFVLLECGPGRGTLMADMMRAVQKVAGFHNACQVHLMETSPVLREKQGEALSAYCPQWHDTLDSVPQNVPVIVVANEFLDALPFRQLVYLDGSWHERVITNGDDGFVFSTKACPEAIWPQIDGVKAGDVYEFSPARESVVEAVCQRIKAHGGAGLFIDYGHAKTLIGDTFQGVKGHVYAGVLEDVGDVDLTSHVDFGALYNVVERSGCFAQTLMAQGDFLRMLGIDARAAYLAGKGGENVEKDLHRLTDAGEMGELFKVMDIRYGF